ncbi:hypothetical protein C1S80_19765 [Mycolicibacterium aubagnense]|nr:hypothetical protein C1S80_19765 [Mycolicibacterium aubagnense]
MRVFVSCQIEEKEAVRKAYSAFEAAGMVITHDWTRTDEIGDKYKRADEAGRRAKLDIDGVCNCDIYVLLSSNEKVGKGMYVELGAALALSETNDGPEVYVVGPMNHLSIFYLHPAVTHYDTIDDLIFDLTSRRGTDRILSNA